MNESRQTIEIELSGEELKRASRASQVSSQPRRPVVHFAGIAAGLLLVIGAAYGYIVRESLSEVSPRTRPLPVPETRIAALPEPEPVRVRNPFDASETFEFPAGTSPEAAHDAVADLLLQRAAERRR